MRMTTLVPLCLIVLLVTGAVYLGINNLYLRQVLNRLETRKEQDLKALLLKERQTIIKDVGEKYKADMVSFEALAKRMQIERQKTKDLEEKLRKLKENK